MQNFSKSTLEPNPATYVILINLLVETDFRCKLNGQIIVKDFNTTFKEDTATCIS